MPLASNNPNRSKSDTKTNKRKKTGLEVSNVGQTPPAQNTYERQAHSGDDTDIEDDRPQLKKTKVSSSGAMPLRRTGQLLFLCFFR